MAWRNEYDQLVQRLIDKYATGIITAGKRYYVDSVHGSDGADGLDPSIPLKSIFGSVGAMSRCISNHGDYIICLPGHAESIIAAAGGSANKIGVTIVFLGNGSNKAKITFSTAVGADINFTAAGVRLIGPKFVAGIDALTGPLDVDAADLEIYDAEWHDATDIDTTDALVAGATSTRLKIDGWKYFRGNEGGTQKQSQLQFNGVDDMILKNIDITGNFETSPIENITDELLNVGLENIRINNTNATGGASPGITLDADSTGWAKNVDIRVVTGSTFVSSVAKINWDASCLGYNADGEGGEPIGTADTASVEGKLDVIDGYFDVPAQSATTNTTIRDVLGNKTDPARNALSSTYSVLSYLKGLINEVTVPAQSATANGFMNDVIGNKTDPARNALSSTYSLLSYIKGLIEEVTVPAQSATANGFINDVVGNKTDPARNALSSTYSVISYLKGLISEITVPAQSATENGFVNDVVGNKTDPARNALSSTYSVISYLKGLINELTVPAQSATDNGFINDVIGNKTDPAKYTAAANLSAISYIKGILGLQDGLTKDNSRYLSVAASLSSATWNATATHEILAVSGTNRIRIIPYVTADVDCSAGGMLKLGTSTSNIAFLGSTSGVQLDAGEYWFFATGASNTKFPSFSSIIDIITNLDVGYTLTSETSHGNIRFLCWYEPLEAGASVAAGAGGAL